MQDNFLICRNCSNWGQPWLLHKKIRVCENSKDRRGSYYTSQHPACKHFIPIQAKLPDNLQRMRLFVQTLSPTQMAYFAWSLAQASMLLVVRDSVGKKLSLGDQVTFRLGAYGHTGTVEGVDPKDRRAIVVHCPSFANSSIVLLAQAVTKVSKEDAKKYVYDNPDDKVKWHTECLIQETTLLRSKQELTKKEQQQLLFYEQQLNAIEETELYKVLITSI